MPVPRAIQGRAVRLLLAFFANDDERSRRAMVNLAFGDCERDPRPAIQCAGSAMVFADHLVETLLRHGCAGRGRHALSLLLTAMASARGRQSDPDYAELPRLLDGDCCLPTRDEERRYLRRLLAEIEAKARLYAPLRGIADLHPAAPSAALLAPWGDDEDIALLMHRPRQRAGVEAAEQRAYEDLPRSLQISLPHGRVEVAEQREYEDVLSAFGEVKQAALLGAPGAGKSTTLRRLAADLARDASANPRAPVPILVSLGDWRGDEPLSAFLAARVPEIGWAAPALSRAERLILLLDGLNEVPTAKRAAKAAELLAFKDTLPAGTACIVSCRRDDYVGELDLGLDTLTLEPLTPQRIRQVLCHWLPDDADGVPPGGAEGLFWQLAGDERLADVLATWLEAGSTEDAFWSVADPRDDKRAFAKISFEQKEVWRRSVPNPRSLLRLAANPFMLTMLYQVWALDGELPRNRGDLFARFVDRLLRREGLLVRNDQTRAWERTSDGERLVDGLTALAWVMQGERLDEGTAEEADFGVLTVVSRDLALAQLGSEALLKRAEDATLVEGGEEIRFRHQLLQEYFTASALRSQIQGAPPLLAAELWPAEIWWERSGWEEAAVLLAGLYSDDCAPVLRWLKDAQPEVCAQCVLESGTAIADREALFRELHDAWLPRLTDVDREPQPEARAAIGRALGQLGLDDRKGVGLDANGLPDIDWATIPGGEFISAIDWVTIFGGEFIYQDGERRRLDGFRIARYPVTNAQFRAFLDADDGYRDDRWWHGLTEPDRNPAQPRWDIPNHPRENVSWFEAMAFCAWLSHQTGCAVRLPTEWEWERAARSTDGRAYPWGSKYEQGMANMNEMDGDAGPHHLARTSAVGIYPAGASPDGVLDLAGNVWEWCLYEHAHPEGIQPIGGESRVVRGGSWLGFRGFARADFRFDHPRYRGGGSGFRVLCASPIR